MKPATTTTLKKTSLGKRKKSQPKGNPDAYDDLDFDTPRKKIQKVSDSNMIELSFVQTEMACACGFEHTITLSDDGTVHSFGRNSEGELGLGHNSIYVSLPTPIPNLPKINMVSCGFYFTVCVDDEGFIWSFGKNEHGQLGIGNTTNFNVPQKLQDIPLVVYVTCGGDHIDSHK